MSKTDPVEAGPGKTPFTATRKLALAVTALLYLAGAVAIYAFTGEETLRKALSLPAALVAALLGLSLINYAVRAWRWVVLGDHLGFRVPVTRNVLYYLAGFCMTSTP